MINRFVLAYAGRLLFHFRQFTTKKSFMHRLNPYLLCADTKAALIFLAKASIRQIFQQAGSSFLTDCFFNCTRRFDQCICTYKTSHVYMHRQTQTW